MRSCCERAGTRQFKLLSQRDLSDLKNRAQAHPFPAREPIVAIEQSENVALDCFGRDELYILQVLFEHVPVLVQGSIQGSVVMSGRVNYFKESLLARSS